MKKLILLLTIFLSHVGYTQTCPTTPVQHSKVDSLVARKIKLCGATPGLYKFNSNFHFVPATAGIDYSTPSTLSDSLDGYLKLSGGTMLGAIDMDNNQISNVKKITIIGTEDSGTPDAAIRINRILNGNDASGHGFRDNTDFADTTFSYCAFDAAASARYINGSETYGHIIGFQSRMFNNSQGYLDEIIGCGDYNYLNDPAGEIGNMVSFISNPGNNGGPIGRRVGLEINDVSTPNLTYGIYIKALSGTTRKYAIRSEGLDNYSYHNGRFGIGTDVDYLNAKLHVTGEATTDDIVRIDDDAHATVFKIQDDGTLQIGLTSTLLKTNSSGEIVAAVAGTDYQSVLTNPITGTGAAVRLALWKGTSSQTSDSDLTFDTTANTLTSSGDISLVGNRTLSTSGNLLLRAAGGGAIFIGRTGTTNSFAVSSTGNITLGMSALSTGTTAFTTFTQPDHTGGAQPGLLYTGGTLTGQAASTEVTDQRWNNSATMTHATGNYSLQRTVRFSGRTHAFTASSTITESVNVEIDSNSAGANAIFTNNIALKINGNVSIGAVGGGLRIKEGANATMGTGTLVGGTLTVNTIRVTANSRIFITIETAGGTQGFLSYTKSAGTSFTVTSTSGTDTSTFNWWIIEPAP